MDVKSIENLAKLMKENGLTSLELTQDGISLKLESGAEPMNNPAVQYIP